jgi:zinc protease
MRSILTLDNRANTVVLVFIVRVGSIDEQEKHYGISHLLEHMMFQSKNTTKSAKLLKRMADSGTSFNAMTSFDTTIYYIIGRVEVWKEVMDLFHMLVFDPMNFSDAELRRESQVVLEEASTHNHTGGLDSMIMDMLWKDTSYEHPVIGNEQAIRSITSKDLHEYHDTHYGNSHLVVNMPKAVRKEALEYVNKLFARHVQPPTNCPVQRTYDLMKIKASPDRVYVVADSTAIHATTALLMFSAPPYHHDTVVMIDMLTNALTGLSGILTMQLRGAKGYTYGVAAESIAFVDHGIYCITFNTTHTDVAAVMDDFFVTLRGLKDQGMSERKFTTLKHAFMLGEANRLRDPFMLTMRLASALMYSDKAITGGMAGYMANIDALLTYAAFCEFLDGFLKFPGAKLLLTTFEEDRAVHEHVVAGFEALLVQDPAGAGR